MERASHPAERSIALVTGAAQGIGRGIAESLAEASYKVVLADIDEELLEKATAELLARGFAVVAQRLDVASDLDWSSAISSVSAKWGGLDLLVNCAGISPRGTVESTSDALWDQTLSINLKGPWLGIKAALPFLRERRGTIVNIGSTRATRPMPGLFSYIVSKAGLVGTDATGGSRISERVDHLQHDRSGLGGHAQRAIDPGEISAARIFRREFATSPRPKKSALPSFSSLHHWAERSTV